MRKIDRFDEYMKIKDLNDNKVTNLLSLSVGTLGKSRKEGRDLSANVIEKILNYFNDINSNWLLTGEGTMFRFDATASTEEEEIAKATDMYKAMMEELARMKKELEDKDKFIEKLNERIDMQDNVIKRLLSDSAITPSKCNG